MSNNDQNSEVLSLLQSLATKVDILTTDMQLVKNNQQALTADVQALTVNQQTLAANQQVLIDNQQGLNADIQALVANQQALSTNQQALAANQQVLTADVQILMADMQEVKMEVREIKGWTRVTDNRLDNMDNKLVDFASQITSLDQKVEEKLYDTRPMWKDLKIRLDKIEAELLTIKGNQDKSDESTQQFRQELISRFRHLEKDVSFYRKHAQTDVGALAKDVIELELRLEKVESKLEIKN